jgi:hypothetical protein
LPQRGSRVHGVTCGLKKRGEPDAPLPMVPGHHPGRSHASACDRRCREGHGRVGQDPREAGKPKSNFPSPVPQLIQACTKFCPGVGNRTDQHLLTSISFRGCWAMRHSSTVERPVCLTCKHRMGLARISPGERGFEERTFECRTCHRIEKLSFAIDPLKTDAVGWLASELRPPR